METKIQSLENEKQDLETQKSEAVEVKILTKISLFFFNLLKKTLRECVDQKEIIEFDLYSKFVQVLNEKKAKIRELTELAE